MKTKKIVVRGGGENLYKVNETNGTFYAYKIKVSLIPFCDSDKLLGKTKKFEDALALIKSHSGRDIDTIS
jgi:hypothetical protein